MALIICPECKGKVSDKAEFCPHCGLSKTDFKFCPQIGNEIKFGKVKQNNTDEEPIIWTAIDIKKNKALLISKYCIDRQVYDKYPEKTDWRDSYIRKWLNGEFYESAFTPEEQILIRQTTVDSTRKTYWEGEEHTVGSTTKDKIFLLSYNEIKHYLSSFKAIATLFTKQKGAYCNEENCCSWWLRTPGVSSNANTIWPNGAFSTVRGIKDCDIAVRPAMWININHCSVNSYALNWNLHVKEKYVKYCSDSKESSEHGGSYSRYDDCDDTNNENIDFRYDIENDIGPDDDAETYEYYYGDDEI